MSVMLKFVNQDAIPKTQVIKLARQSDIALVMAWYGAYFAGDNYQTYVNGRRVAMDINGELKST